jgi:hypothetical protein
MQSSSFAIRAPERQTAITLRFLAIPTPCQEHHELRRQPNALQHHEAEAALLLNSNSLPTHTITVRYFRSSVLALSIP